MSHFPGTSSKNPMPSRLRKPLSASSSHTSLPNPVGGWIDISHNEGAGTSVIVSIPLLDSTSPAPF